MTEYLLAAVQHHPRAIGPAPRGNGFIDAYGQAAFNERIAPLVTDNSLILMEGNYHERLLRPGDSDYEYYMGELPESLSVRPTLCLRDPRFRKDSRLPGKLKAGDRMEEEWEEVFLSRLGGRPMPSPKTFAEALQAFKAGLTITFSGQFSSRERELARWAQTGQIRFDREYMDAMKKYGHRYDRCVLIAGALHCMSIAIKTGYEVEFLADPKLPNVHYFSDQYIIRNLAPGIVLSSPAAA